MCPAKLTLTAPAKINLWLRILNKRPDGFHALETRMCPISVTDLVTVERSADNVVSLTCSDESLPTDETNLAMKALRLFEAKTNIKEGWNIHLEKHIPHGAGLGGGSSDAASVLDALNQISGSPLSLEELCELAGQLGSDVPFFLYKQTCDATGRGEIVTPVSFPWKLSLVLIKPGFGVPTPWAYQKWAASEELVGVSYKPQPCEWGEMINDLERPVFQKFFLLPTLKNWLLEQPETLAALMSGSGSTMYAITQSPAEAETLADKAQTLCGELTWVKVAQTIN
jgi:4-diphosphocytidyl-2-C-methyl-D-erythritol kinase